jgi:hypothetical protein
MCVLECIYIAIYLEQYKKLKGTTVNIIPKLKKFYKELFNKPFPEKFDGLDITKLSNLLLINTVLNLQFTIMMRMRDYNI